MFDPTPWANSFKTVVNTVGQHAISSVLTVFLASAMYLGYETVQRGSFWDAVQVLATSKAEREHQAIVDHAAKLQEEIRAVASADKVVQTILDDLLDGPSGNAVRARVAVIHNGVSTVTNVGLLKADIVAGVAERGRAVGASIANQPLSQWSDYLRAERRLSCRQR